MRPRGMATDGHHYFDAPEHSDIAVITKILRQGLLKGLSHNTLADKVPLTPPRWKHIAPLPYAGPQWKLEKWTYHLPPDIVVSDRMTFSYRSAYVSIDPWSVLASLSPAPAGRTMPRRINSQINILDIGYVAKDHVQVRTPLTRLVILHRPDLHIDTSEVEPPYGTHKAGLLGQ
jgi:hypothetical protein